MTVTYEYVRAKLSAGDNAGLWDIDNPDRVDGTPEQIHLATEIEAALPGKIFHLHANEALCKIDFSEALSAGEETTLDTTVSNHKNNV